MRTTRLLVREAEVQFLKHVFKGFQAGATPTGWPLCQHCLDLCRQEAS